MDDFSGFVDSKKKKKHRVFQQRQRRQCFGELVQMDGSDHDWFEERTAKCCLIVIIDDATGKILSLFFCDKESTENYFKKHGKPFNFYTDKHSVFKVNTTSNQRK